MAPNYPNKEESQTSFSSELQLIPRWSVAAAILAFVVMEYLFWVVFPHERQHPGPPIGLRLYFARRAYHSRQVLALRFSGLHRGDVLTALMNRKRNDENQYQSGSRADGNLFPGFHIACQSRDRS